MGPSPSSQSKPRSSGMDFLQSASNAVAGNVAGPVDLIGMGLRAVGVPVPQNPVGGSQWMTEKGLMRDVPMGPARIAGETFGMAGPVAAAANAPRLAQAFNQAGANLQAPRTLNPQTGAIVWHGSPHKFDRFDSSKIGTGEGAQAYGHGLYLAETPEVARTYKSAGADPSTFVTVRSIRDPAQMAATALERAGGDIRHAQAVLAQNAQSGDMTAGAALQLLKQRAALPESKYAGNMYKVDLPDEKIARMLDWDKPLSQQAPEVQQALGIGQRNFAAEEALIKKAQRLGVSPTSLPEYAQLEALMDSAAKFRGETGATFYTGGDQARRAAELRSLGIPGIRYLDGGSRNAGAGSSNFVVFPGEEEALKILERNGQPLLFGR